MGCAQSRQNEKSNMISCEIKYLLPELVQAIKLGQQCLYSEESPIKLTPVKEIGGVYCKLESLLPSGSVKMRAMYNLLHKNLCRKDQQLFFIQFTQLENRQIQLLYQRNQGRKYNFQSQNQCSFVRIVYSQMMINFYNLRQKLMGSVINNIYQPIYQLSILRIKKIVFFISILEKSSFLVLYHMLYRLQQKKRHKGIEQLNLVICSSGNAAMACIECLKLLKQEKKQELQADQTVSEFLQDDTPTDPGQSALIKDQQLSSKIKPYELLGQLFIFCKHLNELHRFNDLPNVKVINSQLNKSDNEIEAFKYAEDNGYDYLDLQNDVDVFGGYATIGFEIDQWQVLTNTKIDYVFVTLKSGALIAAIAFYLKYIVKSQLKVIGVMLYGSNRREQTICSQIIEGFIDEIMFVTTYEVEKAQCELAKAEEIAEFNSAIAYAGCKKTQYKNSLVVLSGSNVPVSDLSKLISKYE